MKFSPLFQILMHGSGLRGNETGEKKKLKEATIYLKGLCHEMNIFLKAYNNK